MNSAAQARWVESALRGAVLGVVLAAHWLALMVALVPAWYGRADGGEVRLRNDALQLHFLPPTRRQLPSRPRESLELPAPVPAARRRVRRRVRVDHSAKPASQPAVTSLLNLGLPPPVVGYEAGGADFHARLEAAKRALPGARLPGSGLALVAGLPFADPKAQGAAGIARSLQHMLGVVSKHCVDVDVWRNMPRDELLKRHISDQDVERVAAENGCL